MFLKRLRKEMSLKEIVKEEDDIVRCNKLHWFLKRKFLIGTIISILTFLLAIVVKAGAYKIMSVQMPIFQVLVIIYVVASIVFLTVALAFSEIKFEKEKHFYRWALFYDLYNFFMECICVFLLIFTYLFAFVRVSGPSMKPTYKSGDILACFSIGYRPKVGDAAIIYMKEVNGDNALYVKRIVAGPGDTITYDQVLDTISVNDKVIESSYANRWTNKYTTITLEKEEYFVFGDNRGDSMDSRNFGVVKRSDIVAKVNFKITFWT